MSDEYIQDLFAERIGGSGFGKDTKVYKFEKIKRAKAAARKAEPDKELLDFGVGEPDEPAFPEVVEILCREAGRPENRGYADNGIDEFKVAAARYMERVFNVPGIDPENEVNHSIGSKPALAMLPDAFINPGDVTLMTSPGYPVLATHTEWNGGRVVRMPLLKDKGFLPDLDAISEEDRKAAKLLYLNYPNNPTGAVATREFFERAVKFARENNVVVVHDAAYAALSFTGEPLSILSVPGGKDVAVELHSFSKAYNMTGWRLAFAVGSPRVVSAFANVKDNNDSGQFIAIQKAGIYCLENPDITGKIAEKYRRRLAMMVDALNECGFSAEMPKGSFFLYVGAPTGAKGGEVKFSNAEEVSQYLITNAHTSTVPWDEAGAFVRFSATFAATDEDDEKRVIGEMKERLAGLDLVFG